MLNHRHYTGMLILLVSLASVLSGCTSFISSREEGFTLIQKGFSMVEPTPGLYQEIELKHIKVVIVGSREQFRSAKASQMDSHIMGYANSANEIWIFGKEVNGQIIVNEAILGHELMHLLGFENPVIANPDQFRQNDQLQANFAGLLK